MACHDCINLGIPEHLCSDGKPEQTPFIENELLYRRHDEIISCDLIDLDIKIVQRIFTLKNDSTNRSSLSDLEDVLIDDKGNSYDTYGILSIPVEKVKCEFEFNINGTKQIVKLEPKHEPVDCNYAHAVTLCYINGKLSKDDRPPNWSKILIRRHYLKHASIAKKRDD